MASSLSRKRSSNGVHSAAASTTTIPIPSDPSQVRLVARVRGGRMRADENRTSTTTPYSAAQRAAPAIAKM